MKTTFFGKTRAGEETSLFTISRGNISISVTDYGAALVNLFVKNKDGEFIDVVLGFDNVTDYEDDKYFLGVPVGRSANRIGGATFELNGQSYTLDKNEFGNNLHSGLDYYNKRIWKVHSQEEYKITFSLHSPDGDQGYPGAIDIHASYELAENDTLVLDFYGVPSQDTIINMTNHSYFNLNGHDSGSILNHLITIDADFYTQINEEYISTGELVDVTGTPMDFRTGRILATDVDSDYEAIRIGGGYDHNWVFKPYDGLRPVAKAVGDQTGITMEMSTDLPCTQLYIGNYLDGKKGKAGAAYEKRSGFCLETQYAPDAIHHENFESPVCKGGTEYKTTTTFRFYQ